MEIYSGVEGIEVPQFDWKNIEAYKEASKKYVDDLRTELLKQSPNGKNVGVEIQFPVADGYARYMVASMRPLELVHIALDDAYHFSDVELYTAKQIQLKVDQAIARNAFFAKKE